jgi:hypothetical protein
VVRKYYLDVTFGSESATIYKRCASRNTLSIDVEACLDIVEGVGNNSLFHKEVLIIDVCCAIMDLVQASFNVALEVWVHLNGCCSRSL